MRLWSKGNALFSGQLRGSARGREGRALRLATPFVAAGLGAALLLAPAAASAGPPPPDPTPLPPPPAAASADPDPLDPTRLPPQVIYNYGENETTRSAAMGGALRALGSGTSAVLLNPAAMLETRVYHSGAVLQFTPETGRLVS